MSWALLVGLTAALGIALLSLVLKRRGALELQRTLSERRTAERTGAAKAQLQYPIVDLTRCLGCGACVRACPEEGVLALVHGQAAVVRGAHCVGTAACAQECPTGAIAVTLADLAERRDVPVLEEHLEAHGTPGLFLAGEVTAHALVKTAVDHGTLVAAEVARRVANAPLGEAAERSDLDLVIVGAGPAGIAAALEAKRHNLRFVLLDQEQEAGGTVARYPRRKLVLTQPIDLPLFGRLPKRSYAKEELIALWHRLVDEHELPLASSTTFEGLDRREGGGFSVRTNRGVYEATHVCLALGRRGVPNRLDVPGEDLAKVSYSLLDADSFANRRVLVVGGGDSAVEAALGLIAGGQNEVTLSYRKGALFRVKPKNEQRLEEARNEGRLRVEFETEVVAIEADRVHLRRADGSQFELLNDDVLIMAGGKPPFPLLEASGVCFDPNLRPKPPELGEQGSGLLRALATGFALSLGALLFALFHLDYYGLPTLERPTHPKHDLLRPGLGLGLALGIGATLLIGANLLYLLRRQGRWLRAGALTHWMTAHVSTGILAFLAALLHAGMGPRDTVGGQAFWVLGGLVATGVLGRYLYAYVPRAANGRELELAEVKGRLANLADGFERVQPTIAALVRDQIGTLIERRQWKTSLPARLMALVGAQRDLGRLLARLRTEGARSGLAAAQLFEVEELTLRAHRAALVAAHLEDLRGLLASWRWLHRWGALLVVLLIVLHVVYALAYGAHLFQENLT